jgi:hypothetical protein
LTAHDTTKWMRNHKYDDAAQVENLANILFGRDFFNIMDISDGGTLDIDEMSLALVGLGLASDSSFIGLVCRSLQPDRFGNGKESEGYLTIKDFSKIFNKDHFADKLL